MLCVKTGSVRFVPCLVELLPVRKERIFALRQDWFGPLPCLIELLLVRKKKSAGSNRTSEFNGSVRASVCYVNMMLLKLRDVTFSARLFCSCSIVVP